MKVSVPLGTVKVGAVTFKVTGIFRGLLVAPADVICMVPVNGPAVVRLKRLMIDTVSEAGVAPPPDTLSQELPDVTLALTVALPGEDVMVRV